MHNSHRKILTRLALHKKNLVIHISQWEVA